MLWRSILPSVFFPFGLLVDPDVTGYVLLSLHIICATVGWATWRRLSRKLAVATSPATRYIYTISSISHPNAELSVGNIWLLVLAVIQ